MFKVINEPQQKHTPEPWKLYKSTASHAPLHSFCLTDANGVNITALSGYSDGRPATPTMALERAQRIVQCVNACAGIANPGALSEVKSAIEEALGLLEGMAQTRGRLYETLGQALAKLEGKS